MVVIDASVLLTALVSSDRDGSHARRAIVRHQPLHAPQLVYVEVLSAIRGINLAGRISDADAEEAVTDLAAYPITVHPHPPLLPGAFHLRHPVTAYDAMYIVLAATLDVALLAADEHLGRAGDLPCEVRLV